LSGGCPEVWEGQIPAHDSAFSFGVSILSCKRKKGRFSKL